MPNVVEPKRQQALLRYLARCQGNEDQMPTRAELGRRFKVSSVSAHLLLKNLERRGYVKLVHQTHRGIRVTKAGQAEAEALTMNKSRSWL